MAFPEWSEEHEAFRSMVRRFALEEIRPNAEKWQAEGYFPDELFRKAGDLGLLGVRFDPRWGGSGLDYWYTVILVEELARGRATPDELITFCKTRLARFKVPKAIDVMPELPKTAVGKILRRALREPYWKDQERGVHGAE